MPANVIQFRKKDSYWKNDQVWVCPNHIPPARLPAQCSQCWYSNCSSTRPERVIVKEERESCAWEKCDKMNGKRAYRRDNSKYCSLDCKNKNARWRYKLRKKGLLPAA